MQQDKLFVENNLQRKSVLDTTKKGLNNLREQVRLILHDELEVMEEKESFSVKLPTKHIS